MKISNHERILFQKLGGYVIGCDEVGRGSLAGPVVAAAVCVPKQFFKLRSGVSLIEMANDSKLLSAKNRDKLNKVIKKNLKFSIAKVSAKKIDRINIHNAVLLAMQKSVEALLQKLPDESVTNVYIDGKHKINFSSKVNADKLKNVSQETIIKGDTKLFCIAAASIVAKVSRDNLMNKLSKEFCQYGWDKNKAYGTLQHIEAIKKFGLTKYHRKSFCFKFV